MLKSTMISNDILSMLGNGAKLIASKLGGSQKHIGSKLKSIATSNDTLSILGN